MFQSPQAALAIRGLRHAFPFRRAAVRPLNPTFQRRQLLTLAIETSCDDTSVAILEKHHKGASLAAPTAATLHFLGNATADSKKYMGIHPVIAHESHQENLARLIDKALHHLPTSGENDDPSKIIHLPPSSASSLSSTGRDKVRPIARRKPDFISVTRGPGMRMNLLTGLDTAKGLAVAWQVPLVGVHHMQAHLLTPGLVSALQVRETQSASTVATAARESSPYAVKNTGVEFPFLSLLVSGGHTLLVHSTSIIDHSILAQTKDAAIGDAIDKLARNILPPSYLEQSSDTMYGKVLESFAFPNGASDYADYEAPASRAAEIEGIVNNHEMGWKFTLPMAQSRELAFSFTGILPIVEKEISKMRTARNATDGMDGAGKDQGGHEAFLPHDARVALARDAMAACFGQLGSRTIMALEELWLAAYEGHVNPDASQRTLQGEDGYHSSSLRARRSRMQDRKQVVDRDTPKTLVVSGGVAANRFLLFLLRSFLDVRGFGDVEVVAPPPKFCTDNAAMIGWAGLEMFEAGWRSQLEIRPLRKWSLDASSQDGGVLGPEGWVKEEQGGAIPKGT